MTTTHIRHLQQYTQDNYNNTHKTTTTIHTRQLQQYTQENYNNTHGQLNKNLRRLSRQNLKFSNSDIQQSFMSPCKKTEHWTLIFGMGAASIMGCGCQEVRVTWRSNIQ